MKKLSTILVLVACLVAWPLAAPVWPDEVSSQAPPVAQPLVPEGYFAVRLAEALKIGHPETQAQAEDMLGALGIQPRNGWIADYPMTPDVYAEIWNSTEVAADAGRLPMGKTESLQALRQVALAEGLPITEAGSNEAGQTTPNYSEYMNSAAIDNYYADEGPPVVTYYPPPPYYGYLYSWVPYPFWWSGIWLPGYWCLNDFDVIVTGHFGFHHHGYHHWETARITNHIVDPRTGRMGAIDPARRDWRRGMFFSAAQQRGFRTAEARNQASSILRRSEQRRGTTGRPWNTTALQRGHQGRFFPRNEGSNSRFSAPGRNEGAHRNFVSRSFQGGRGQVGWRSERSPGTVNSGARSFNSFGGGGGFREGGGGGGFGGFHGGGGFGGFHGGGNWRR